MIKRYLLPLLFAAISLAIISCGSTPESEPESAPEPEAVEPEPEVPAEVDTEAIRSANQEALERAEAAREAALAAGAESAAPLAFAQADENLSALREAMERNEDVSESLSLLSGTYGALKSYAAAVDTKAVIDENGFASYDRATYNEGDAFIEELTSATEYTPDLVDKARRAEEDMNSVLDTAYRTLAREERTQAFIAKRNADSVRCAVSRKEEYDGYVENFRLGDSNYVTGNPQGALDNYTKARAGFTTLYEEVSAVRAQAQAAIEAARARVTQSEDNAVRADEERPLGDESVEGIEDEDAVLLPEDDFSEAYAAEVDVPEVLEEAE